MFEIIGGLRLQIQISATSDYTLEYEFDTWHTERKFTHEQRRRLVDSWNPNERRASWTIGKCTSAKHRTLNPWQAARLAESGSRETVDRVKWKWKSLKTSYSLPFGKFSSPKKERTRQTATSTEKFVTHWEHVFLLVLPASSLVHFFCQYLLLVVAIERIRSIMCSKCSAALVSEKEDWDCDIRYVCVRIVRK